MVCPTSTHGPFSLVHTPRDDNFIVRSWWWNLYCAQVWQTRGTPSCHLKTYNLYARKYWKCFHYSSGKLRRHPLSVFSVLFYVFEYKLFKDTDDSFLNFLHRKTVERIFLVVPQLNCFRKYLLLIKRLFSILNFSVFYPRWSVIQTSIFHLFHKDKYLIRYSLSK